MLIRRLSGMVLAIVFILGAGLALAQDRRFDEMEDLIEDTLEDSDERDDFLDAAEEYVETRTDALELMIRAIQDTRADPVVGYWRDAYNAIDDIPDLYDVDDDLETEEALRLYNRFIDEERSWLLALGQLNTAQHRDTIVSLRNRLEALTVELDDEWNRTLNQDNNLDERQYRVMADIYAVLLEYARDIDTRGEKFRLGLRVVSEVVRRTEIVAGAVPGELAATVRELAALANETIKAHSDYKSKVDALRPQLRELVGQELGLFVIFNETRASTQRFIDENNFDAMKRVYEQAEDELERFEGVGTSYQRADAGWFVDEVMDALDDQLAAAERIFNAFVAKHNLKFFGPISPDITDLLVEGRAWRDRADEAQRVDLETLLRRFRDDSNVFFGVSLTGDGISEEEREYREDELEDDFQALGRSIEEMVVFFSAQNLSLIYDRRDIEAGLR